jgi:hypothetical protein
MADTIKDILDKSGVLQHVILPTEIALLLAALEPVAAPVDQGGGIFTGSVQPTPGFSKSPIPGFDFALGLPTGIVAPAPFKIKLEPAVNPTGFKFWLVLAEQGQVHFVFKFVKGLTGMALTGAKRVVSPSGDVSLEALPPGDPKHDPVLVSRSPEAGAALGPALVVFGTAVAPASMRFSPDTDSTDGIVAFGLEPSTVVFGSSSIGFDLPALVIDDSEQAKASGQGAPALDPPLATISADTPSWRGILARELDFYLPTEAPYFGGQSIKGYLAIPTGSGGVHLVIEHNVPSRPATPEHPKRLGYSVRIECIDPTAQGLSGLAPTLISASMELPLDGAKAGFTQVGGGDQDVIFAAGKPVRVTATFARDPVNAPDTFRIAIGVAAQGQDGLLSVTSTTMGGAKIFNTAAALATALIADKDVERSAKVGNGTGVLLYGLVAAGAALSSLLTDDGRFVLHGAEIESTGHGLPVGGPVVLTLDYSVAVRITQIDVGVLAVSMNPDQPMRIRIRSARMSLDPSQSGLKMIGLDFDRTQMEIENPGAWNVEGLESLFDVLGSRSGRGSTWMEVDLRFKLNLGPVQVSGATIRATLNDNGSVDASVRGLEASLTIPGAIEGKGKIQLIEGGFAADLLARLLPLNVAADAGITYAPPMIVLRLDIDLPAPIPLANSGFGLMGIGGLFGIAAEPKFADNAENDPILRQLQWQPNGVHSFKEARGQSTFGFDAAVGTLPDLGFSFSAKMGLLITVPDVAVRGSLNGRVLQPAVKVTDPSYPPPWGLSFLGFISVDASALDFAVIGMVDLKPLLEIKVPIAGHFPFKGGADDWYLYLGADGAPTQGRSIGPISAVVLPGILDVGADAYFMLRGRGLAGWPYGRNLPRPPLTIADGFVVAFGFGLQSTFGVKPIVWAELYASLDLLIGAKPPTLAGFGRAGGSLNLGPFSLGVEAVVSFMVSAAQSYFWAEVTARIELLFFEIEGTVTISFGDEPPLNLPNPDRHPLDNFKADGTLDGSLGSLTDDTYRVIARLAEEPNQITDAMQVWPDAIISLPFAITPEIAPTAGAQFPAVLGPGAKPPPKKVGSEMLHYLWRLDGVTLLDVTDEPDGTPPPGPQLAAAWQVPRTGGSSTDVSELVLFSTSPDLWVNRLADAGEGADDPPLKQAADLCNRRVSAEMGWAIGFLASEQVAGFRLPPDPVSFSPLVSRVDAQLHHFGLPLQGKPQPLDQVYTLPLPFSLEPAQLVAWPQPEELKRPFEGHLLAPDLRGLPGLSLAELMQIGFAFLGQQITLDLFEPILNGLLILVADPELFQQGEQFAAIRVIDDRGHQWVVNDFVGLPNGDTAALMTSPSADPAASIAVSFPLGRPLGVVGLGGITVSARDAADRENKAIADEVDRRQQAAAQGPKTTPGQNSPHERTILEPGRLYRLDITMSWSGELFKQDESGQVVLVKTGAGGPDTRRLFFKTTPKPVAPAPVKYGLEAYLPWVRQKQDAFHPEMLERYLAGYEPGQSVEFRFCDDPVRAHFKQDHAAALAKAYGFDLKVAVRRVDRPGPEYASAMLMPVTWTASLAPDLLSFADQVRFTYAAESACTTPKPGATASVLPPLETEAWYEVYMLAQAENPAFNDSRLPGVTFKTSRWRTPQQLFAGLGFPTAGEPAPEDLIAGDLVIAAPAAVGGGVIEGDDQAYQRALVALGLDGWPAATSPRLSRMWMADAAGRWLFAGLMIESPEPVHRAGRLELSGLALKIGAGPEVAFDVRRRDRSGARLIYLASQPFQVNNPVGGPPGLLLTGKSTFDGAVANLRGALSIPATPAFSEDPS